MTVCVCVCVHSWVLTKSQSASVSEALCLHGDSRTVKDCEQNKRPPPASSLGSSGPVGFEGRAGAGLELPWDYPSLGFWLGLRQNPGELLGLVCVCVRLCVLHYGLGRASVVLCICYFAPRGNCQEGLPSFHLHQDRRASLFSHVHMWA